LVEITRREVAGYVGYSPFAKLYPILDDTNHTYAVVIVEQAHEKRLVEIVIMARVIGNQVVIEEETTDKPLVEALMVNGGIPREQIVLAYRGETPLGSDEP
jgi:hypothetical protein